MTAAEALAKISITPTLLPLTEEQKGAFLGLWGKATTYKQKQRIVGAIPNTYQNRERYGSLLEMNERYLFFKICKDPSTLF